MKQMISFFAALILAVSPAMAQDNVRHARRSDGQNVERPQRDRSQWQDKMKAEKIAFLTGELALTSEDAERFWPVYHEAERERRAAVKAVGNAYRELDAAIKEGKDVDAKLQAYLDAQKASQEIDAAFLPKFRKVLSSEQVARLYLAEEKFRRQQIHRFHGGDMPQRPQGGDRHPDPFRPRLPQ